VIPKKVVIAPPSNKFDSPLYAEWMEGGFIRLTREAGVITAECIDIEQDAFERLVDFRRSMTEQDDKEYEDGQKGQQQEGKQGDTETPQEEGSDQPASGGETSGNGGVAETSEGSSRSQPNPREGGCCQYFPLCGCGLAPR